MAQKITHLQHNIVKATVFAVIASLFLSLMFLFAKLASTHVKETMTVFFRFLVTAVYIFAALLIQHWRGKPIPLKTKHLGMHGVRALFSTASMYTMYYALNFIPVVDANLLGMTYPLFVLILSALFFQDKASGWSWLAMSVGFVGIIFVLKPGHELFQPAMFWGLLSGFCAAGSALGVRELTRTEHTYTIMFYLTLISLLLSSALIIPYWHMPDAKTMLILLGVGLSGTLYQDMFTRALAYASPRVTTATIYLSVIFSTIFGMLVWQHFPDYLTWIGMVLICVGNIFVVILK